MRNIEFGKLSNKIIGLAIEAQVLTYMKLSKIGIGLLINFNEEILKDGVKRFVL